MSEQILVRFARKPCNLNEVIDAFSNPDNFLHKVRVTETKELSAAEFDQLTQDFFKPHDWMAGKGGIHNHNIWDVIAVTAPDRPTLYISPEGYNYARYVGLREEPKHASSGPKYPNVRVQLVGKDGNAWAILGRCQQAAKNQNVPPEEIKAFMDEAHSGDYNHLLATCMRWFDCF